MREKTTELQEIQQTVGLISYRNLPDRKWSKKNLDISRKKKKSTVLACLPSTLNISMCQVTFHSLHACLVVPDSWRPHGLYRATLLCPWDFPGKNTEVGCHFFLQEIFLIQESNPHLLHWQVASLLLSHVGSPHLPLNLLKPQTE